MSLIIWIIVISSIDFLMLLPILIVLGQRKYYQIRYNHTIYYIKEVLGYIVGLNGPIRTGKTSGMSGIKSVMEIITINQIQDLFLSVKRIFKTINFNEFNSILNNEFSSITNDFNESESDDFITHAHAVQEMIDTITLSAINYFDLNLHGFHFNMIGYKQVHKLIKDYVEAYWVLNFRQNYVQSKTPFYSNITGSFSMSFDVEWTKIRDAYASGKYALLKYMVILIDESTDDTGAGLWQEDAKDKAGAKEFRRKFGHLFEETTRLLTTKQDVMDEVKKYRNLTHSNLILDEKVKQVGGYTWIYKILERYYTNKLFWIRLFKVWPNFIKSKLKREGISFSYFDDLELNETNKYRIIENKIYYLKAFFKSISYNRYYGYKLNRAEDIDKSKNDRDEFALYIPTFDCFGTYDTHYYRSMQDDLLIKSNVTSSEVNIFKRQSFFEESKTDNERNDNSEFNF